MEDQNDIPAGDEQALSDRIDDEIVNRELMERLDSAATAPSPSTNPDSRLNISSTRDAA